MRINGIGASVAAIFWAIFLASAAEAKIFRAGASISDVTPLKFPAIINGMFLERVAEKATDPIHARSLVLDDGVTRTVSWLLKRKPRVSAANRWWPIAVISQAMANLFWPGENPIGKRFRISFTPETVREVVGVVGDIQRARAASAGTRHHALSPHSPG
jgi:hypothetical protein